MLTILDALRDKQLLGASPALHDPTTWRPWMTFLACVYGLPIDDPEDLKLFKACTGRSHYSPPPGGFREAVAIVGRQSGKTRVASNIVAYESAFAEATTDGAVYSILCAQDWRSSIRAAFSYLSAAFQASPVLRRSVSRETTDTLDLVNGYRCATYPCRPASIRGLRAKVAVCDEIAYFRSTESGYATDTEMLRALRPCLATTGGKLVVISSPYGASGALWELHRRHFGRDDSPTLVWVASAPTMNPTLSRDYLERMRLDDPEAYRSEVLGEFRAGIAQLLDFEQLDACVVRGRGDLLPIPGSLAHRGFVDPSGGRADAFGLAIAHLTTRGVTVDVARAWPAPFEPSVIVREAASLFKDFGITRISGDRYAGEYNAEAFRAAVIRYEPARLDRSGLYLELLPLVSGRRIELPDNAQLLRELRTLERRTGPSGRDRVDHIRGAHDDLAPIRQ